MEVFTSVSGLQEYLQTQFLQQNTIGLVPTMGALHEGHIALIRASVEADDVTVCSIFVNPTQFNNAEDLAKYPRTLDEDLSMLHDADCDVVFAPSVEEMYPTLPRLKFDFGLVESVMEGASRPGHFNGVGIVVSKLFHIVKPQRAYFGQKDLQQVAVIRQLVADLSFDLELVVFPTVREDDGLAMSSRNRRLSESERAVAPHIYRMLRAAKDALQGGKPLLEVQQTAVRQFADMPAFTLDYFEIVDALTLQNIDVPGAAGENAICVAAQLGPVRLIDNILF